MVYAKNKIASRGVSARVLCVLSIGPARNRSTFLMIPRQSDKENLQAFIIATSGEKQPDLPEPHRGNTTWDPPDE